MIHPTRGSARVERLETRRLLSGEGENLLDLAGVDSLSTSTHLISGEGVKSTQPVHKSPSRILADAIEPVVAQTVGGTGGTGQQPAGALSGKIVFTVGGHGFVAFDDGWHTQRGVSAGTSMNEDQGNQDQMTFYVNYLFNAGATVVPLRPVGYQPNEVLIDNDDAAVTYTGTWSNSSSTIFYGSAGDVPYRFAAVSATETATARYTPNFTKAGFYPVYTWVKDDTDRINQLYRVVHTGGTTEVKVDHRRVGKGYVYLGTYYFNAGTAGYVEISNKGTNTGSSIVVADHIRFGNGMGDIDRGLGPSGLTRSDESALYWIEHQRGQGVSDSVFRGTVDTDDNDNVGAPPRWAAWMNRETAGTNTERIFLSYHSNAGSGTSRGTEGLYNGNNDINTKTPHQFEWAQLAGKEVNDDLVALTTAAGNPYEYAWNNRTNPTLDRSDIEFGEINNYYVNDEFDATIVEVAYHDNVMDAALMRDPKIRDLVARASLQATIKYFRQFNAQPTLALPPDQPTNVRATTAANGDVTISWNAPVVDAIGGETPTGYVVYTSSNGLGFANPIAVAGGATLTTTISAASLNGATYFRVAASNAGGESLPTEVVAARAPAGATSKVLIVNGFDRIARTQNLIQTTSLSYDPPTTYLTGTAFERVRPRFSNSFDYASRAGEAIKAYGTAVTFDTTSNEALIAAQVSLSGYNAVIWLSGEESTADDTFNATEQTLVTNYLTAGGKLFVSGAEIGWDLESQGGGASFYNNQLKAAYNGDDAGTYTASGAAGSIFAGINIVFDDGTAGAYDVEFADKLLAVSGSTIAMNYTGAGSGGAAVQYANPNGGRVVNMGFPFETLTASNTRNAVMTAVLNYFSIGTPLLTGAVAGRVFRDSDADLTPDGVELMLSGRTVWLDVDNDGGLDAGEPNAVTNVEGEYLISGVAPGSYKFRATSQNGFVPTFAFNPALDQTPTVTITAGTTLTERYFSYFQTSYTGSAGKDAYTIRNLSTDSTFMQVMESFNGGVFFPHTILKTILSSWNGTIAINAQGGADTLTINMASSSPLPSVGNSFTGGSGTDNVIVTGSSGNDTVILSGNSLNAGGIVTLATAENVTVNGNAGDDNLTLSSPTPTVVYNGNTSTTADSFNISTGTYTLGYDVGNPINATNMNVSVASGATLNFGATQHLNALTVTGNASLTSGGNKVLVAKSLSVPGKLNLTNNDLILNYTGSTQEPAVRALIASGRNNLAWNGNGLNTSSFTGRLTGLGHGEASTVLNISGAQTAVWSGETVDSTSILVKFTYTGDANLSGLIEGDDYFRIDSNYAQSGTVFGFHRGDFNYDNLINGDDYFAIDSNFNLQGSAL